MVLEAVAIKVQKEDADAEKKAEQEAARKRFKEDKSGLDQFR